MLTDDTRGKAIQVDFADGSARDSWCGTGKGRESRIVTKRGKRRRASTAHGKMHAGLGTTRISGRFCFLTVSFKGRRGFWHKGWAQIYRVSREKLEGSRVCRNVKASISVFKVCDGYSFAAHFLKVEHKVESHPGRFPRLYEGWH